MAEAKTTKFKYIGEFPEGQDSITQSGLTFEKGKAVEVTDEATIAKLEGNQYFESGSKASASQADDDSTESVAGLTERIATVDDVEALEAELAKESRVTGKAAIEARIAALDADAE